MHDVREVQSSYGDARKDFWSRRVLPFLKELPRRRLARAARVTERTVQAVRNGRATPSPGTARRLIQVAGAEASRILQRPNKNDRVTALAHAFLRTASAIGQRGG